LHEPIASQNVDLLSEKYFADAAQHTASAIIILTYTEDLSSASVPMIATNMLEESETLTIQPLADTRTWRQNSAFEVFAGINNIYDEE